MPKNPKDLLTIGIPTYNRSQELQQTLQMLEKQIDILKVKIIISDNASTDDTRQMVQRFINSSKLKIKYLRNRKNIGFDGNIINIYSATDTQYVWFFSDDDMMVKNGIKEVLKILRIYNPTVLYPNQLQGDEALIKNSTNVDMVSYMPTGINMKIKTNTLFQLRSNQERLIITRLMSFISGTIVRVDSTIIKSLHQLIGTGIMQDAITSQVLYKDSTVYISNEAYIQGSHKKYFSRWFMESTLFGVYKLYSNETLHYPQVLAQKVGLNNCKFALFILATQPAMGIPVQYALSINELKKLIKTYNHRSIFLLPFITAVLLSQIIPKYFIRVLYNFVFTSKK